MSFMAQHSYEPTTAAGVALDGVGVFPDGRIVGRRGELVAGFLNPKGYLCVHTWPDGIKKKQFVHRLVATAFIPNPDNKPQVNHRDGDKLNNDVKNLEWATPSENLKHAFSTGLKSWINRPSQKGVPKGPYGERKNPVFAYHVGGNRYSSLAQVALASGITKQGALRRFNSPLWPTWTRETVR